MPKLNFTALAEADLDEIWFYIAQDNPVAADRFVEYLRKECLLLAGFTENGEKTAAV